MLEIVNSELARRKVRDRGAFYEPNDKIEGVIQQIGTSTNLVYILSAANGIGKTTFVVNLLRNIFFGPTNRYFSYPLFKDWPYPKRARYITTPKNVENIGPFYSEIQTWWPKGKYTASKNGRHFYSEYVIGDWVLDVMTYDQHPDQFEGPNIGLTILDEPPPQSIWPRIVSRLRKGGLILVVMTPLTEAAWFFDQVIPRHEKFVTYADVEAACKQHGVRGHLEHHHIEQMISEYPEDEKEARISGKAMHLKGVVYKSFDPTVHVLKEPFIPPLNATLYNVVDPHADKPFFSIWAHPHKNGDITIVDEHPNEDFFKMHNNKWTIEDYKRMYASKEYGYSIERIIDRHFAETPTAANKKTLRQELADIGLDYNPSYAAKEEIETGVLAVRSLLKYDTSKPITSINRPRLRVNPHCKNTIKGFQYWSINPENGKYREEYKDPMDVVRYLVMADPTPSEPMPDPQYKKLWG